jgi:hypothetical protein
MNTTAPEQRQALAREDAKQTARAELRAERRRGMITQPHHPVRLAGLHAGTNLMGTEDHPPLFVERRDQNFVAGLFADLAAGGDGARERVFAAAPAREEGVPRLFPPLQRVHNLALLEAFCDVPGTPRLDRKKVASCGLVLRRIGRNGAKQAWLQAGTRTFGWDAVDENADPVADKRIGPLSVGHPHIDKLLPSNALTLRAQAERLTTVFGADVLVNEDVTPLFLAPPAVALASGRTILFGTIPVMSSDQAESPPESPRYGDDPAERAGLHQHLVHYLKAGNRFSFGGENLPLSPDWVGKPTTAAPTQLASFVQLLQQLHLEFDAFGDSAAARAVFTRLNEFGVERTRFDGAIRREPAGDFLREAKRILLDQQDNIGGVSMPAYWAAVAPGTADLFFEAAMRAMDARYLGLGVARGRFDDPNARYVVRAFIRVKGEHAHCPPTLVWSPYSEPFSIAPWFECGGGAPALIPMPDLFDRAALRKLKPSVSFTLPPKLANLLQTDPDDLIKGKNTGPAFDVAWICSFSIPIITLCAFIVLSIFLGILNLIFFWLPFLKICLPLPKPK